MSYNLLLSYIRQCQYPKRCKRWGCNTEGILLDILPSADFPIYRTKSYEFIYGVSMQVWEGRSFQKTCNYIKKKLVRCQSSQVRKQFQSLLHSICWAPFSFVLLDLYINYMTRFQLLYWQRVNNFLKNKENYKIFAKQRKFDYGTSIYENRFW